jgi:hypothetical protein
MTIGRMGDLCVTDEYVDSLIDSGNRIIGIDPSLGGCGISCIDSDGVFNTWIETKSSIPAYYRMVAIKDAIYDTYQNKLDGVSFFVMEAAVTGGWSSPLMFALSVFLLGMCAELNKPVLFIHVSKLRTFVNHIFSIPKKYEKPIIDIFSECGYVFQNKMGTDCVDAMLLASIYSKYVGLAFPKYADKWDTCMFKKYLEPLSQNIFLPKCDYKITKKDFNGIVDIKIA